MTRKMPPPLALFCLLAFALFDIWLVGEVAGTLMSSSPSLAPAGNSTDRAADKKPPEVALTQFAALSHTLATPAFFKSRSPYVPTAGAAPPTVAPPPVLPPPAVTIAGIMINKTLKKVLLMTPSDAKGVWLGEGEQVMGWKVDSIDAAGITLRQNSAKIDIKMYPAL